jgi:hypothetical protein
MRVLTVRLLQLEMTNGTPRPVPIVVYRGPMVPICGVFRLSPQDECVNEADASPN